tara:strand:+ start:1497 stop:1946 length:450 start_codon:yes stop_codon:yes gene_type:complete
MVATWKESVEVLVDLFKSDWLRANTNNIQPVIIDIADDRGERGKRLDLGRHDYVLLYETAHNEEVPDLFYNYVTTRINVTVDIRTIKSRTHLQKMENETRRAIHAKRKGDGANYDRLLFKTRTDLSDRTKKLFRHTFQVEVITLAELIP